MIERNGIALADVGDSYTGVFRHLCNQITNLVSLSMNLFAIMLNENVSILNGQGIKICSGNNGSSFLTNFKRASVHDGREQIGTIGMDLYLYGIPACFCGSDDFFSHIVEIDKLKFDLVRLQKSIQPAVRPDSHCGRMIIAFLFHSVLWQGDSEFVLESIIGDGNGVDRDLFRNVDSDGITLNDSQGVCSGIFWKLIEFFFV